jgi:hypothetical protein
LRFRLRFICQLLSEPVTLEEKAPGQKKTHLPKKMGEAAEEDGRRGFK